MIEILYSSNRDTRVKKQDKSRLGSWISVVEPTDDELASLSETYKLDIDLLTDATDLYETPRVERDGDAVYIFARYCHPQGRDIATEPILIVYTKEHLFTVSRIKTNILDRLTQGTESITTTQKTKTFLQILGAINYSYERSMYLVNKQLFALRTQLAKDNIKNESFVQFIDIEENLNEYLTALQPQAAMLRNLLNGKYVPLYEEDKDLIEDLSWSTTELTDLVKSRLKTIASTREAYSTIMANNLNKTFKKLTSISIFLTIPAITAALYGMNLRLPLSSNPNAFWLILLIVMAMTGTTIWVFKKLKWL